MDLISNLGLGFDVALTPVNILYCFVGVLLGTLVGVLPGIGPTGTVAILLPITFTFEPVTALIMLDPDFCAGRAFSGSPRIV